MTDREKTVAALDKALVQMHGCGRYTPEDVDELETAAWGALKLLEEQKPDKMMEHETTFEKDGHHIRCTHCNSYWCSTDREGNAFPANYCPECGRTVKWDDN